MTVGERIAARRKQLNMTQDELARKLGYKSRSSINKIEMEWSNVPLSKLEKVGKALDCSASYLMGWEELSEPEDSPDLHSLAYQSADEQWIIKMYRKADEYDKETVRRLLGRYDEEGNQTSEKSG